MDLAEALARRYVAPGREHADLLQVAYLGLVKAARGFDSERGGGFPAYAAPTIRGELKRYLRDRCWMVRPPRPVQDLRSEILWTEPDMTQRLGRRPTDGELAAELGTDVAAVREAHAAAASMRPDSLDAVDQQGQGARPDVPAPLREEPWERLDQVLCLRQAIGELAAEDRELLYRRYFCEDSQADLGKRFGVSQMQVSRRLARVLVALQRRLLEPDAGSSSLPTASSTSPTETPRRAGSGSEAKGSPRLSSGRSSTM
jgi:RNA polymerase sigma-B factor